MVPHSPPPAPGKEEKGLHLQNLSKKIDEVLRSPLEIRPTHGSIVIQGKNMGFRV